MATEKSTYEIYNEYIKLKKAQKKAARQEKLKKGEAEWNKNIEERREADKKRQAEQLIKKHPELKDQLQHILEPQKTDSTITPDTEYLTEYIEEDIKQAEAAIMISSFSTDDVKGIKSLKEMRKIDPAITEKDYQHALNAWYIAQEAGKKIGVDPRLIFGQFGAETLFRDSSVLEQYNYGNIKHFDKWNKNVPQYKGQKPYKDNQNGSEDYYLRFDKIEDAIDWYANRYAENSESRHKLIGTAKNDALAFSQSLFKSGYYEGDPNKPIEQRPYEYQRGIVSQANKWLSNDPLTAQQYSEDPYFSEAKTVIEQATEVKAKPLVNPYGQNVPLKNMPKGILAQPARLKSIRDGDENLPKLSSGAGSLLDEGKVYAGKQGQTYVESDRTLNALLKHMGRGYIHRHGPMLTKGAGPDEMMDVKSVAWPVEKPVQKEIIPGEHAYTTAPGNSNIASLDAINKSATEQQKIASADLTVKEEEQKKIDGLDKATTAANIINATNAAVGLGLGIYGASQINKMQRPSMISAPQIEAAKIRDTGAQAMAAHKGMIEQSANTSREALRRAGRSDLNATITAGETRALNEAAGAIEGMRANINAANVAAENRVREINASTKMQADQFNSQIQSAFNQFKSQLGTQNLSTTVQNISGNLGGIAQNIYAKELRLRDEKMQKYAIEKGAL